MTQRPTNARRGITRTAAMLLVFSPVFHSVGSAAGPSSGPVYPRASVSSDAYRTPPGRLNTTQARPLVHRAQSQPRAQSPTNRPIRDRRIRQIDHQEFQQNGQTHSVRAELERLYSENGREMPQMPTYSPASSSRDPFAVRQPASPNPNAAPPVQARPPQRKPTGLLSGLFDFNRSRRSRDRARPLRQPPAEPAPFRPPTYRHEQARQQQLRQQQMQRQAQQRQSARTQAETARPSTPPQQPAGQVPPADGTFELRLATPQRGAAKESDEFFPGDDDGGPDIVARDTSRDRDTSPASDSEEFFTSDAEDDGPLFTGDADDNEEDLSEFFPEESSAVAAAADSAREQMQELLRDHSPESEEPTETDPSTDSTDNFQMPIKGDVPAKEAQEAPAQTSDVATTQIGPLPEESPQEPSPFFADDERAIDPDETMEITELEGETFDPSGADSESTAGLVSEAATSGSRMQRIAARDGVGLKGYCPVALRDKRRLADGKAAYVSYYRGKAYHLSSEEAKETFDASPSDYAPASAGEDVTMKTLTGEVMEGSLDHSVWYKGRLYLFHSAENLKTFMAAPSAMAVSE